MTWQPGQSGNPGGRARLAGWREVRRLCQLHTEDMVAALVEIAKDSDQRGAARVQAACAVLDRGWGRPEARDALPSDERRAFPKM